MIRTIGFYFFCNREIFFHRGWVIIPIFHNKTIVRLFGLSGELADDIRKLVHNEQ